MLHKGLILHIPEIKYSPSIQTLRSRTAPVKKLPDSDKIAIVFSLSAFSNLTIPEFIVYIIPEAIPAVTFASSSFSHTPWTIMTS